MKSTTMITAKTIRTEKAIIVHGTAEQRGLQMIRILLI
jgi:hypothetical protein